MRFIVKEGYIFYHDRLGEHRSGMEIELDEADRYLKKQSYKVEPVSKPKKKTTKRKPKK